MNPFAEIIIALSKLAWPALTFFFIWKYRESLITILGNIGELLLRTKSVKLQTFSWSARDVKDAIYEREKLKISVLVAGADLPDHAEFHELKAQAKGMKQHIEDLNPEDIEKLIDYSIELASADGKFSENEYEALLEVAKHHNISLADLKQRMKTYSEKYNIQIDQSLNL